jgi:3-dehydroquinate synthase class II
MSVKVMNMSGDPIDTVSFKPSTAATVLINGEPVKLTDLKVGDPITIWVSETRFSFYTAPGKGASPGLPPRQ